MAARNSFRLLATLLVALCLATGAQAAAPKELDDYDVSPLGVGGPFTLTDQNGQPFSLSKAQGQVLLMFFGYTYCPDVCPLSMSKLAQVRRGLGASAHKVRLVFITIDPERDTPARMKAYVENFPGEPIGLTGSKAEIEQVAKRYATRFSKGEDIGPGQYLMAHTAYLYVLDAHGKVRYMFPPDIDDTLLASATRWVLGH